MILLNKNILFYSSWSALYFTALIFWKIRVLFHSTFSCSQHAVYTEGLLSVPFHLILIMWWTDLWCLPVLVGESAVAQFIYCFFFLNLPVVSSVCFFSYHSLFLEAFLPKWLLVAEGWNIIYWLWVNPLTYTIDSVASRGGLVLCPQGKVRDEVARSIYEMSSDWTSAFATVSTKNYTHTLKLYLLFFGC